jgi:hypothetical protein
MVLALAAGSLEDGLAEAELLAALAELAVLAGGVAGLGEEVQAALASSATPATSTVRRVLRRVDCTRRGYPRGLSSRRR